jgi:hypothetical protein
VLDSSGVSELVELLDVTGESGVEELPEGDGVAEGVSIVPDLLLNTADDVSEGSTKVLVLELIDSVYDGVSESLEDLLDDAVVQYE